MRRRYLGIYTLFFALFGLLGYLAHRFQALPGDGAVSTWLQDITSPVFASLMESASTLGEIIPTVITVALIAGVLLLFRQRLAAAFFVALPAVSGPVNYGFKLLVDRPRPGDDLLAGGTSFPSGHTTYAAVLAGFCFYLAPRFLTSPPAVRTVQGLSVVFVLLIGTSRIYLGAHQPSDVLGSLLLSGLLLAPAIVLHGRLAGRRGVEPEVPDARTA